LRLTSDARRRTVVLPQIAVASASDSAEGRALQDVFKLMTFDESHVVLAQACVRRWLGRQALARVVAQAQRRVQLGARLLQSERLYLASVQTLLRQFHAPLAKAATLADAVLQKIFGQLGTLELVSVQLVELLTAAAPPDEPRKKASKNAAAAATRAPAPFDVFPALERLTKEDAHLAYISYATQYPEAMRDLAQASPKAQDVLRELAKDGASLADLLSAPLQRVQEYMALCKELLAATPAGTKAARALEKLARSIGELATLCTAAVVSKEDRAALAAFQARFGSDAPDMVVPGRKLLLESDLFKQCRKAPKPYTFFLLSDAIVYAVPTGGDGRLKFHQILRFRQNRVRVTDAFSTDPQRPFAFKVISTLKSFVVYCPNVDVKQTWIGAVRDALVKLMDSGDALLSSSAALEPVPGTGAADLPATPRSSAVDAADDPLSPRLKARKAVAEQTAAAAVVVAAPVWVADAESNECLLCHAAFTFTKRRHHCRRCGKLVCAKCSSRTLDLGPELGRKARACELCFNAVQAIDASVVERSAVTVDSLGSNLLELIFSIMSARDLTLAARVCKRWNAVVARDGLWLANYRRLLLRGDVELDAPMAARGAELESLRLSDTLDAAPAVAHTPRSRRDDAASSSGAGAGAAAGAATAPVTIVALSLGGNVAPLPAGVQAGELKRCFVELLRSTRKWRLADSHRPRLRVLRGHTAAVTALAINPIAGRLFSGSTDCDIKQWDIWRAEPMASDSQLLCAHASPITAMVGDWSSGGVSVSAASNAAAAAAAAAAANVADEDDPSSVRGDGNSVRVLRLYSGDKKGNVVCWEVGARRGKVAVRQKLPLLHDGAVRAIAVAGGGLTAATLNASDAAFNSDGGDVRSSSRADRLLISVGDDGALRFSIRRKGGSSGEYEPLYAVAKAHDGEAVTALHVVVQSRHIITGGADRTVRLWDAVGAFRGADIAQCVPLAVHVAPFEIAALSYRSGALAYAGNFSDAAGYAAVLWEARTGKSPLIPSASLAMAEQPELTSSASAASGGAKSAGSQRRTKSSRGGTASYQSVQRDASGHDLHVLCLVHDNVSRRVAAGMEGDEWAVWTESGAPVCRINVGRGWVRAVELSGVTMVVGCGDGSVLLYDFAAHSRVNLFGFDSIGDARSSPPLHFLRKSLLAHQVQLAQLAAAPRTLTPASSPPTTPRTGTPSTPDNKKKGSRIVKPATAATPTTAATATPTATTTTTTTKDNEDDDDESSSSIGEIG
jgi:WD40 repeat protein